VWHDNGCKTVDLTLLGQPKRLSQSYRSTKLTNGIEYSFTVTATNEVGVVSAASIQSPSVVPSVTHGARPGAPTNIKAQAGNHSISLTFEQPLNSGSSSITGYQATCSKSGVTDGESNIGGVSSRIIVVGNLENDVLYGCTVKANNQAGYGDPSDKVQAMPVGEAKPSLDIDKINFDSYGIGKPNIPKFVTLTNKGNANMHDIKISKSGDDDFTYQSTCGEKLTPNAACTIQVSFTPTKPGVCAGTLSITTAGSNAPLNVELVGTVLPEPKLRELKLEGIALSPAFTADNKSYGATVTNATDTVTVTALAADDGATLSVNGKQIDSHAASSIGLQLGTNILTVRVTDKDGKTSADYTVAITRVTQTVSAGGYHSVALNADGKLFAWGDNTKGQLGDDTTVGSSIPKPIEGSYMAVTAGDSHTVALKTDGALWAWGDNTYGQLGINNPNTQYVPQLVGAGYVAVAAGQNHTLGIKNDGVLWAWGDNSAGQCNDSHISSNTPVRVGLYRAVAAGAQHTLALTDAGELSSWGLDTSGQLGHPNTVMRVVGNGYKAISAAGHHSMAIKTDGSLWAWGANDKGQLGDGTTENRSKPTRIGPDSDYQSIAAGFKHSLAIKTDGSLWAWGANDAGQLGDKTTIASLIPKKIGDGFYSVSAGGDFTVAVKNDGSVWSFGTNRFGQLGDGTLAQNSAMTLVVNDTFDGFFDLIPDVPNIIIADEELPPFLVQVTEDEDQDGAKMLSSTIKFESDDLNKDGNVYVMATLESDSPLLGTASQPAGMRTSSSVKVKLGSTGTVTAVLTRNGWKQSTPGMAIESVYSGALSSSTNKISMMFNARKFISDNAKGIFCVGYAGASAKSAKGLMRSVVSGSDATLNTCPTLDLSAPSDPQNITATATGPGQVKLTWTAASDNVGVVLYNVYRGTTLIATLGNVTSYDDISPQASAHDSYSVMACDAANNCSGRSTPIDPPAPTQPNMVLGKEWNLVGNGGNTPMSVRALFGDANKVVSLWKWVKSGTNSQITYPAWAFYTPLEADGGAGIAAGKGYDTLSVIQSGEGFWVRANEAFSVPMTAPVWILSDVFAPGQSNALTGGWNLIATGEAHTPSAFKETVGSFKTLWAWNNSTNGWYFYSPALEASGGLAGYLGKNGYLDFGGLTFQPTTGFWVNMP
jgi:alpha-tubulin suppressor-like RCC1 family protein